MDKSIYLGGKIKQILKMSFSLNSVYSILHIFENTKSWLNVNLEFLYNWDYLPSKALKRWEMAQLYNRPYKC